MFISKNKIKIFEQTQSNLIKTQENLERTQQLVDKCLENNDAKSFAGQLQNSVDEEEKKPLEVLLRKAPDFIPKKQKEEKWKAAYALNLCTVSVSQIVEYDDIRTLDQEYNTILNNLNLQNIPKDDALLDILKQLLNVITFYKIQEGDKAIIEKEYRHKMKNAVWNAVPNVSVILSTPDPKAMLFNLATQVGIGYMNYRKEKASTQLERDKQKWQLKRSAMEQINGLRRELFDTAWRLSKEYDFDDELRLSESQIKQYNKILLDSNPSRKYERLLSIQKTFAAYPPFWYYLGHTAAEIKKDAEAIGSFYEFLRLTGNETVNRTKVVKNSHLLREDQLCASCALELAGLVSYDKKEMLSLLAIAVNSSGKALDVLQMCAMSYCSIQENEKAIEILRYLVNENYNIDLNANLLSKLYFYQIFRKKVNVYDKYKELKERDDVKIYMIDFPSVASEDDEKEIIKKYNAERKEELYKKSRFVFNSFSQQIENEFFSICYRDGDIAKEFSEFLSGLAFQINSFFYDIGNKSFVDFQITILKSINQLDKSTLYNFITNVRSNISIKNFCKDFIFRKLLSTFDENLTTVIETIPDEDIFKLSYAFDSFCLNNKLPVFSSTNTDTDNSFNEKIMAAIYSDEELKLKDEQKKRIKICLDIFTKYKDKLVINGNNDKLYFAIKDDEKFNKYMEDWQKELSNYILEKDEVILAVLNDRRHLHDQDLVFTTDGYFLYSTYIKKQTSKDNKMLYSDELEKGETNNSIKIKNLLYQVSNANSNEIRSMIHEIDNKINHYS